jgi:3-oxoacyl-[acyl-carrier protein] reductase
MAERLKGKVAIVTGAGRGLGRAEALLLASEGAKVVVNDLGGSRDGTGGAASPADSVVGEIKGKGGEAVANYDSVTTAEGGENIVNTAVKAFGRLDILVNNAGILRDRMIFNMTAEEWDLVIKVHLYGTFNCTRPACVVMKQQKSGRIINTSSESGLGAVGQANYSAAKEGIVGFTRTVARDMGRYGVTCNAIRPRAATRLTIAPEMAEAIEKASAEGKPMPVGKELTAILPLPEEIAPFVIFLATDAAANINGCTFFAGGSQISLMSDPVVTKTIYNKTGAFTLDDLLAIVPGSLAAGLVNPSPPQPAK